jgi:hypothetical protein
MPEGLSVLPIHGPDRQVEPVVFPGVAAAGGQLLRPVLSIARQQEQGRQHKNTMIYLASPYHHPDPGVMAGRLDAVRRKAGAMTKAGLEVYSPIDHHDYMAEQEEKSGHPHDWAFWQGFDMSVLHRATSFHILRLPGWGLSCSVASERVIAAGLGLECHEVDP